MKRFSKKVMAIVGTATLAVGFMAFPVLAGTNQQKGNGWVGQMQGFMQSAMQTEDVKTMQELMNSDPVVKDQIGQDNLDKMNQFMTKSGGSMMGNGSGITGSRSTMMNGNGSGNANKGSNMMGSGK